MNLIKRCPTCGADNKPSEMMCSRCFGDISGIAPTAPAEQAPAPAAQPAAPPRSLLLRLPSGAAIPVSNGDSVGRSATGREQLAPYGKVSRQHARFLCSVDGWSISDLGSANGTYLNGSRIPEGTPVPLTAGSRINLSLSLELIVEEAGAEQ